VDEEASQELVCRDDHDLLLATASVVLPEEGDAFLLELQETMVGDGDAVGLAGQIVENVFRSTEGWLGIDVRTVELNGNSSPVFRLSINPHG
jgi:hypothetical protein